MCEITTVIYFGPAKVLLGAWGKYLGAAELQNSSSGQGSILLITLKGKLNAGMINWFVHRWTESL